MKKVNFKKVLIAFVAVFALMFIGVEKAEAQSSLSSGLFDPAPGTFIGAVDAKDVLVSEITGIKGNVAILGGPTSPGASPLYTKGLYYSAIYDALLGGKSVSVAIGTGLKAVAFKTTDTGSNMTRNQLNNLRLAAIDLLN